MKKVLVISLVGLGTQGISNVIYNYLANMDLSGLKIKLIAFEETDSETRLKFEKFGELYLLPNRKRHFGKYLKGLVRVLTIENYDCIHIHGNSGTMAIEAALAKMLHVKKIILHGHSTSTDYPILSKILSRLMMKCGTDYIACSQKAGDWLYGNQPYTVLNNAVSLGEFRYDKEERLNMRRKLGVTEEYLIGHIGHFTREKNQMFLIDVFYEFCKKHEASKLVLIGDGPLLEDAKRKADDLGLRQKILFLGRRSDVNHLYQAMDIFVLPSLWEGLPLVMIEAQAAGLPVLVSDCVTGEAECTGNVRYKSLEEHTETWAEEIEKIRNQDYDREKNVLKLIQKKGFDIKTEAEKLKKIYCG